MKIGDVVQFKHKGGYPMTIEGVSLLGRVALVWFQPDGDDNTWTGPYRAQCDADELEPVLSGADMPQAKVVRR